MMGKADAEVAVPLDRYGGRLVRARIGERNRQRSVILATGDSQGLLGLRDLLSECSCAVLTLHDYEGIHRSSREGPDVVIVNFDTVKEAHPRRVQAMRAQFGTPVACLLPYPGERDIAAVAQLGADVIVFKPLCAEDFTTRIRLLLWHQRPGNRYPAVDRRGVAVDRRGAAHRKGNRAATRDPTGPQSPFLQIDQREKVVSCNGRLVNLTPKQYLLLSLLASDAGRVFSVDDIIATLWPTSTRATAADVHQCIYALRKRVEDDPRAPRYILRVSSFGYMLAKCDGTQFATG